MTYRDAKGMVLIDDVAVSKDVTRLKSSLECLKTVKQKLVYVISLNQTMSGPTADSIDTSAHMLLREVNKIIDSIDDTINVLVSTLNKYRSIDNSN